MNEPNSKSFEDLLDTVLSGERSPQDPEVRAMLERDDEFRCELENVLRMKSQLQQMGEEREEILAHLADYAGAPGESLIEGLVHEYYQGHEGSAADSSSIHGAHGAHGAHGTHGTHGAWRSSSNRSRFALVIAGVAAAALLLMLARPWIFPASPVDGPDHGPGDSEQRLVLGSTADAIRAQVGGELQALPEFQLVWEHPAAALGTTYFVVLYELQAGRSVEIHRTQRLQGSPWNPKDDELELLANCDSLQILALDIGGAPIPEEASAVIPASDFSLVR